MTQLQIYKGTLSPSLTDTIAVDGLVFDLTGSTVTFKMRPASSSTLKVTSAATVVSAVAGTVRYDWLGTDTDTVGEYEAWWSVLLANGKRQDTPEFSLEIIDHAPESTTDLCTLEDVREAMTLDSRTTSMDDVIQTYITRVSNRLQVEYGKFQPAQTAAIHRFRLSRAGRAKFFPYFCTAITAVTLHPESIQQTLSSATPDWFAEPFDTLDGAYTSLKISPFIPLMISPVALRFGTALVDVTGNWGFTNVPDAVKMAAIITVRSWVRRDMAQFGNAPSYNGDLVPQATGTYGIPAAARDHMALYSTTARVY